MIKSDLIVKYTWCEASDVEFIENRAIGYINSIVGYAIEEAEYSYEITMGGNHIFTPQYPITSITSFELNSWTAFTPVYATVWNHRTIWNAWKVITEETVVWDIKIIYKAGYKPYVDKDDLGTVPKDLETAIVMLSKYFYKNTWTIAVWDIKSETVDWDKVELNPTNPILVEVNNLLSKYFKYDLVA